MSERAIFYSPLARQDLDEIFDYIAYELENPSSATETINAILDAAESLEDFPFVGSPVKGLPFFVDEYLRDVFETLWANPDVVGFSIWQMNDGRTRERFGGKAVSAMFGGSIAGVFDRLRRPKLSAETVKKYFEMKK